MITEKERAMPTQAGVTDGYIAEYKDGDEWKHIETVDVPPGLGAPKPESVASMFDMLSYEAAMAIGWLYKAHVKNTAIVRIVSYKLEYNVKCYRQELEDYLQITSE